MAARPQSLLRQSGNPISSSRQLPGSRAERWRTGTLQQGCCGQSLLSVSQTVVILLHSGRAELLKGFLMCLPVRALLSRHGSSIR